MTNVTRYGVIGERRIRTEQFVSSPPHETKTDNDSERIH